MRHLRMWGPVTDYYGRKIGFIGTVLGFSLLTGLTAHSGFESLHLIGIISSLICDLLHFVAFVGIIREQSYLYVISLLFTNP